MKIKEYNRSRSFYTLVTRTEIIIVKSTKIVAIKIVNKMIPKIIFQF